MSQFWEMCVTDLLTYLLTDLLTDLLTYQTNFIGPNHFVGDQKPNEPNVEHIWRKTRSTTMLQFDNVIC